jgi:hypothetical protein
MLLAGTTTLADPAGPAGRPGPTDTEERAA